MSCPDLAVNTAAESAFSRRKQCFAIWIRDDAERPFELYKSILGDFKSKLCGAASNLTPILTVEGGAVLEDKAERIFELKADGIAALTLTWNGSNLIASGANSYGGLTDFGKEVILLMNEAGLACDLSHLNHESFFDAIELCERPIATHSCCYALNEHPRNLSDDAMRLIAQRGGIIGLCLYPVFLGGHDIFEAVWRHIGHMLDMGLEKNIAIGSDFDGAEMSPRLKSIAQIPELYSILLKKGLSKDILDGIFYKNADNFFVNL